MRSLWFPFTKCTFHCDAITIFLYHCYSQFNCTMAWCVQNPALWGQRAGQVWGDDLAERGATSRQGQNLLLQNPMVQSAQAKAKNLIAGRWETELVLHMNKARTRCQEGKAGQIPTENEVWASTPLKAFPQSSTNVFAGRRLNLALSGPPSKMLPCLYSSPSGWGQTTFTHAFLLLWLPTTLPSVLHHMKNTASV